MNQQSLKLVIPLILLKILQIKIFLIENLLWQGCEQAEEQVLYVLSEIIMNYIKNLGQEVKHFTELQNRSDITLSDAIVCLQSNLNLLSLKKFFEGKKVQNNLLNLKKFNESFQENYQKKNLTLKSESQNKTTLNLKSQAELKLFKQIKIPYYDQQIFKFSNELPQNFPTFLPPFPSPNLYLKSEDKVNIALSDADIKKINVEKKRQMINEISEIEEIRKMQKLQKSKKEEVNLEASQNPFLDQNEQIRDMNIFEISNSQF